MIEAVKDMTYTELTKIFNWKRELQFVHFCLADDVISSSIYLDDVEMHSRGRGVLRMLAKNCSSVILLTACGCRQVMDRIPYDHKNVHVELSFKRFYFFVDGAPTEDSTQSFRLFNYSSIDYETGLRIFQEIK